MVSNSPVICIPWKANGEMGFNLSGGPSQRAKAGYREDLLCFYPKPALRGN